MESQRAAMQYDPLQAQKNPACPCVSLTSHGKRFFFHNFADSAKCLHEANALCQILYKLAY